ncbi:cysteine peptidase family C39 domain-containing protein [Flavobacterium daejeonense]|uniref:cysteine peptidase family C39 domain-containing protein n=1 Tax=Flavobacterium daejeonense TaxID=350893 RepID=UPI00047A1207|nr:cysteine peptidase family C39 domain-containing protein [Flavobacterium daejeonense]
MKLNGFPCDRQMDMMDCGPACLKMIAKHHGKFYLEYKYYDMHQVIASALTKTKALKETF